MNNITFTAIGYYNIIRSSEEKNAMVHRSTAKYDSKCGRWFESLGCDFSSWRSAKYELEADDLAIESFREKHPDMRVKESFCEVEYGKDADIIEHAYISLSEYNGNKNRSFRFSVDNVTKHTWMAWERAVRDWHATGELKTIQFSCRPCSGPWEEN